MAHRWNARAAREGVSRPFGNGSVVVMRVEQQRRVARVGQRMVPLEPEASTIASEVLVDCCVGRCATVPLEMDWSVPTEPKRAAWLGLGLGLGLGFDSVGVLSIRVGLGCSVAHAPSVGKHLWVCP